MNQRKGLIMKRVFVVILLIIICLSLSACSVFERLFIRGGERLDFDVESNSSHFSSSEYGPVYDENGNEVSVPCTENVSLASKSVKSDYINEDRIARSVLNMGDLTRLARVMKRCDAAFIEEEKPFEFADESTSSSSSEPVDIEIDDSPIYLAYIGSSAIAGSGVDYLINAYPFAIRRWWADTYGDSIKLLTEGQIGTTSIYGAGIVAKKILVQRPDVVFVDFSIDDLNNPFAKESFESLIRTLLEDECGCAVVMVSSVNSELQNADDIHLDVARAYGIPVISLRGAIAPEISAHTLSWAAVSTDGENLNAYGHTILGDLMKNFFENVHRQSYKINTEAIPAVPTAKLTSCRFMNARLYNNTNSGSLLKSYGNFSRYYLNYDVLDKTGWETARTEKPMTFEFTTQYITIMYYRTSDRVGGRLEISVDGAYVTSLECDNEAEGAKNSIEFAFVYATFEPGLHTLEIKMSDVVNEGSEGSRVCVLGIITSQV